MDRPRVEHDSFPNDVKRDTERLFYCTMGVAGLFFDPCVTQRSMLHPRFGG
uniref:Uncharacterized protein n=1 Tax=Candidatus Kentrum sp. LFY TaxID=2126342 RepID=A0A450WQ90_9GAMM|nr:MAG: hypothetical protein BECKLFY1418C_GA0070996_105514 [Candidatus Kentron sp. LFY]